MAKTELDFEGVKLNGLDNVLKALHPKAYEKAIVRTLNELGTTIKKEIVQDVRKTYNVKAGYLKKRLPEKKANSSNMVWRMYVPRSKPLNLMAFSGTKVTPNGLRFKELQGGKTHTIKKGFIGNGGKTAFVRISGTQMTDKTTKYSHSKKTGKRYKREKIRAAVGVSPSQMISEELSKRKMKEVEKKLPDTFKRNFDFYIGKIGK